MCANENSELHMFLCFWEKFFPESIGIVDTSHFRQTFTLKENLQHVLSCQLRKQEETSIFASIISYHRFKKGPLYPVLLSVTAQEKNAGL